MDGNKPPHSPEEERPALSSDVGPHREAPSYDADAEDYTGISAGTLGDIEDAHSARAFAEMIVDTVREGLLVLDFDLHVKAANASFYRTFGVRPEETVGRLVYDLGNGQWDIPELRELLEDVLPHDKVSDGYELDHEFEEVGRRCMLLNARRLDDHQLILLAIEDVTERKRAEAAFGESRTMLQLVLNHIPQGVFWKDRDGRFLGMNTVAARAAGFEHTAAATGLTDYDLPGVTPEQAAFFQRKDQEVMTSGKPALGIEEPLGHPDGTTSWLRTNKVPLRDDAGRVVGVLGTWEDVTERKRTAEALHASEASFRHLADAVPHLVWTARSDGTVDYYNRKTEHYDGFRQHGDGPWEWAPVLHPDDVDRTAEAWRHAVEAGEPYEVEHRVRMADGAYRWHVSRAHPGRDAHGHVTRWYGTATDVHQMKEAETALRENEERLRWAQKAAHVGTWDIDLVTGEVTWSEGVFDLVGLPPEGGVPSADTWSALLHPDDRERVGQQVRATIEAGGSYENEFRIVRPGGEVVWVVAKGHVLLDAAGRPARLLGANYDVTPRKRTEEALRRLNETLEERVEERTRQVRGLSRALALAEQEERRRIAYVLHEGLQQVLAAAMMAVGRDDTARLQALLDEAMEVTRTLSHALSPPFLQGEDVEDLLRWVAERHRMRHGLEVEVEARGDVPVPDPALRVLLYQFVRELLFNVSKHAGTGRARVVAEREDEHVRIVVEDEGAGFDPAELDDPAAVGLGLRSVRERLELVGGRLDIASEPGIGTRVAITVPVRGTGAAGG